MMPITLNDALFRYNEQHLKGLKHNTRRSAASQLEKWQHWVWQEMQVEVYLKDIDSMTMSRYFNKLRPPRLAERTFNLYLTHLKQFFRYCRANGWLTVDPMQFISPMDVAERIRLILSPDEMMSAIENAESPRDRIGLAIGANTGLRAQDLAHLKVGDVNLGSNQMHTYASKRMREDMMPIPEELRDELVRWFEFYADQTNHTIHTLPNDYIIVPPMRGYPVPGEAGIGVVQLKPHCIYVNIHHIVQRALTQLGHPTHQEGFHTLRRSAGRAVFDLAVAEGRGDPIRIAMAFLGHTHQQTTERYLGLTYEKQVRDSMLRGQSFLGRAAEMDRERNLNLDNELTEKGKRHATG